MAGVFSHQMGVLNMDRQCSSCGGFCKRSGCERENVKPTREWVGLTEDEKQFFKAMGFSGIDIVEAKLKEKNG